MINAGLLLTSQDFTTGLSLVQVERLRLWLAVTAGLTDAQFPVPRNRFPFDGTLRLTCCWPTWPMTHWPIVSSETRITIVSFDKFSKAGECCILIVQSRYDQCMFIAHFTRLYNWPITTVQAERLCLWLAGNCRADSCSISRSNKSISISRHLKTYLFG